MVYSIVTEREGNYHFAEDFVGSLNETGRYAEVYRHMRDEGMNLS
jgi:hypothetical protein